MSRRRNKVEWQGDGHGHGTCPECDEPIVVEFRDGDMYLVRTVRRWEALLVGEILGRGIRFLRGLFK